VQEILRSCIFLENDGTTGRPEVEDVDVEEHAHSTEGHAAQKLIQACRFKLDIHREAKSHTQAWAAASSIPIPLLYSSAVT
jgi:hypothetical protein